MSAYITSVEDLTNPLEGRDEHPYGLYSNFDHELDSDVQAILEKDETKFSRHAAWEFSALVGKYGDGWISVVYRYGSIAAVLGGASAKEVIDHANRIFGDD